MKSKIVAALAVPFVVAAIVGAILIRTHHTTLPTGLTTTSSLQSTGSCMSKLRRFVGIAVAGQAAQFSPVTYRDYGMSNGGLFEFYNSFPRKFDLASSDHALQLQAIPLIQLNPGKNNPHVIKQISNGVYNTQIRQYADDVKDFKSCVVLSFGHEMNGWWYRWGGKWTTPATFIKAWRRVHDIFSKQHATNVIWSFDPSHQHGHYGPIGDGKYATPAAEWYPGNKYVNIIGLDGYLGVSNNKKRRPQTFDGIFGFQLGNIRKVARNKRVYLAETGVAPGKPAIGQINALFAGMRTNHLAGLVWFDAIARHDYRFGINQAEDLAYKKDLARFLRKP